MESDLAAPPSPSMGFAHKPSLARADVGYRELAERLKKHGLKETEASIANKTSCETFSAMFLLAAPIAIGAEVVKLEDI